MKTQKCISTLSLALTGLFFGAAPALAMPLLDSDLASFTVLGAPSERYIPKPAGDGSAGRSDNVQAIAAINASPASAGLAKSNPGSQQGVGAAVMQLAQALHLAGNPGREAPARRSSIDGIAAETGKPSESPTRDNRDVARKYFCAMAQPNTPAAAFDPDLCKDISTPNDFLAAATTPGSAVNPSLEQPRPPSDRPDSNGDTGELTEDLQRVLLLATLPVDLGPGGVADFAAFPSALAIDELVATVPEPATLILLALGLAGIGYTRKRTT